MVGEGEGGAELDSVVEDGATTGVVETATGVMDVMIGVLMVTAGDEVELMTPGELDGNEVVEGSTEVLAVGSFVVELRDTDSLAQVTPASSLCSQVTVLLSHCVRLSSSPVHNRLSNQIGPFPSPKCALRCVCRTPGYPSWRHTTSASPLLQKLSHTVPQVPL